MRCNKSLESPMPQSDPVVILSYARTPMGAMQGALAGASATDLGATAVKAESDYFERKRKGEAAAPPQREFLLERTGLAVRSRLMEMCVVIKVSGTDYREARQTSNQARTGGAVKS